MNIKDGKELLNSIKSNSPQLVELYNQLDQEDKELVCYFGLRLSYNFLTDNMEVK